MHAASGWGRAAPSNQGWSATHHRSSTALPDPPHPVPQLGPEPEPEPEPEPLDPDTGQEAEQLEHQIALSVVNLEDQLESVQREAAEVLGLCDSTTAFTNEVRDGLRSARASMAEQRAAMDKILASVTEKLRVAALESQTRAQPTAPPDLEDDAHEDYGGRIAYLEAEVSNLRAERDALSAHIRVSDADLASGDAKMRWKIQWLTQKLQNVELDSRDRQRSMEEEMQLLRARHQDGVLRVRELEEQLNRADLAVAPVSHSGRRSSHHTAPRALRGELWHSDPRQPKLQRDLESLRVKVEQLLRDVADDAAADSRVLEEIEQERRDLLEELLDVEQLVKEKRRNAEKEAATRRAKNSKLRADVLRGHDELEGRGTAADTTVVLELESNILQLSDDLREAEHDLCAAEDDKAALADQLAGLESEHQTVKAQLAATQAQLENAKSAAAARGTPLRRR